MARILSRLCLSDLVACDAHIALFRALRSRISHITWQTEMMSDRLPASVALAARRDVQILEALASRLVVNSTIPPIRRELADFGTLDEHLDRLFGSYRIRRKVRKPDSDPVVRAALRNAAETAANSRRSVAIWRFSQALQMASDAGWYVIFNTLTVRPHHFDDVFAARSKAFTRYVERFSRAVGRAVHGTRRAAAAADDSHRYFAVVESGSRTGRLHVHVVHLCRALPDGVVDPAVTDRRHRKISALQAYWPYGFSAPIAVRYGPTDPFGLAGWRWPACEDGVPARVGSWRALAFYMAKYVSKSLTATDRGDYSWRLRMTRGLGLQRVQTAMRTIPVSRLLALALAFPPTRIQMVQNPDQVPVSVIRRQATREILRRLKQTPSADYERLRKSEPPPSLRSLNSRPFRNHRSTLRRIPALKCRPSLVTLLRGSSPLNAASSLRNIGNTMMLKFMSMAISDFCRAFDVSDGYRRFVARGGQCEGI